jgi:hypothetical protein
MRLSVCFVRSVKHSICPPGKEKDHEPPLSNFFLHADAKQDTCSQHPQQIVSMRERREALIAYFFLGMAQSYVCPDALPVE